MATCLISISFCVLLLVIPLASPLNFKITHFSHDLTDIVYEGDAVPSDGAIEFNKVDYLNRVGWATYADKIRIWDSNTEKPSDFSTHFSFIIDTQGQSKYGHGLSFFLSSVDFHIPPNSGGGFLGLFNTTTNDSPSNRIVSVEFDSFSNPEWDPSYQHVGINRNSIASSITTPWNASLHSGYRADSWITYNSTTKNLTVSWSYQRSINDPGNSSLSYQIDLMKALPEWVKIGFSAATGMYVESHTIQSWEFSSNLDSNETMGNNAKRVGLIVGLTVPLGVVLLLGGLIMVSLISLRKRKSRKETTEKMNLTSINNDDLERGAGPRRFSYSDLASATNNFSEERKLGEGGFGCVFKGHLIDLDLPIAVKKISRGSRQGKKEYITEVKTISQLRHRNLVQLLGWCHDQAQFLLVYEFMPNGSLDAHLFGKKPPLTWVIRYKITLGLASALLYLHEEWEQCVVHRDIKSSNVMLDSSFNVKLGDFGLARLMDHELGPQTTGIAGTLGYLAPEYISTGKASKESDVFSFGVVILEIVTGKRSTDPTVGKSQLGLVKWIWDLYGEGELLSSVDEMLNGNFEVKQVERLMIVGLWCAHPDQTLRASIRQAIQVLHFEAALPDLPTKMPVPIYHVPSTSNGSIEPSITCSSIGVGR